MHEKSQEDSIYTEVRHKELVDNLKEEIYRMMCKSQAECYLGIKEIKKNR